MNYLRRLPKFEYVSPQTIAEACSLIADYREKGALLAGGSDLLPKMKRREKAPQYLISLKAIPDLRGIENNNGLKIGSMTTIHDIQTSSLVRAKFAPLARATDEFGSMQIRNLATVGGNLCSGAPSADTAPPLVALGAMFRMISSRGERTISAEEFFVAPFQTVLAEDELLAEIRIPGQPPSSGGTYLKYAFRGAMDHAFVGVAVALSLDGNRCSQVKIALGSCNPVPFRATGAEDILKGKELEESLIEEAAKKASQEASPRTDPDYKREMIRVFTRRALKQARESAG